MDPQLRRIVPTFAAEAREHLQEMSAGVFDLELPQDRRDAQRFRATCRAAHNLKGSAATLGLTAIEQLAHGLETLIVAIGAAPTAAPQAIDAAVRAVSALEAAVADLLADGEGEVANLEALKSELAKAIPGRGEAVAPAPPVSAPIPEVAPAGEEPAREGILHSPFRAEALDLIEQLRRGLEGGPAAGPDAHPIDALVASLTGTLELLGAAELITAGSRLTAALRGASDDPGARSRALAALGKLQALLAVGSASATSVGASPSESLSAAVIPLFREEARAILGRLEAAVAALRSPRVADRSERVAVAARDAHTLRGVAAAVGAVQVADAAGRLEQMLAMLGVPGPEAVRALVAVAGLIVDAGQALDAWSPASPSPPVPSRPATAPSAPAPEPQGETARTGGTEEMQRVAVATLEDLAQRLEELVMARAREEHRLRQLADLAVGLAEAVNGLQLIQRSAREGGEEMSQGLAETEQRLKAARRELQLMVQQGRQDTDHGRLVATVLREDLRGLRTVPAGLVLEPLRRTARETANRLGKRVEVQVQGAEVRVDRRILEAAKDPLLHLVRNAIDHGLETPERRLAQGKAEGGRLELVVERRGQRLAITVADDGGGLDLVRIRQVAVRRGLLSEKAAADLTDADARRLIFRSGFSTAEQVTAISGRGVGLDVVEVAANRLQGTVLVESEPGRGTRFTLDLPLTLAATEGLLIRVGAETYAVPTGAVQRVIHLRAAAIGSLAGQRVVELEGEPLALATLSQLLPGTSGNAGRTEQAFDGAPALVVAAGTQRLVLVVDELTGQQELVVHTLGSAAGRTTHLAGVSVLDDGRLVPVLNAADLLARLRPQEQAAVQVRRRVLVVDDSPTTRSAMRSLLELAGYEVVPAADGEEAWELLEQAEVDLVVSDVQMPRLDGLGLTRRLRTDSRYGSLPVILVTSLETEDDRMAGADAGATEYLVKREVERGRLLEVVEDLLGRAPS